MTAIPGKPPMEKFFDGAGQSILSKVVVDVIRKVLNDSIKQVKPGQLLTAIRENTSIWSVGNTDIKAIAARVPKSAINMGRPMYLKAVQEYGSATELVLAWMRTDNPDFFSLIINTDGGLDWFDHQVKEMTEHLGLEYE